MRRNWTPVAQWSVLGDREPAYALVEGGDLVGVQYDGDLSALYGRCQPDGGALI